MNYYFEREVKHLDYVQQRKLIREEEKREIALELAKKKAVSEISGRRAVFCSSQWERVAGLIPLSPVRSALGSLLCLRR